MKKHYFLGLAAGKKEVFKQLFVRGSERDASQLRIYLQKRYTGEAILTKNGRSALALALKAYFQKGDAVIVNGFTCYAVYEAIKAAGLTPVFADISKDNLNFNAKTLENLWADSADKTSIKGIIIQNTLGNPVDIEKIESFAKTHQLTIIEDLAHCVGVKYADGREAGTVGSTTVLSFGKDKSLDTTSGGAVILREPCKNIIKAPSKIPKISDYLRERFYPLFGVLCRKLSYVHLGGVLMRLLIKIHWVEKSADNRLDLERRPTKFEARLALEQIKTINKAKPLREFYLVKNRDEVLRKLKDAGYFFDGFWYEKPVSPVRYYEKVHFPEKDCPVAVEVSQKIVNLPTYYPKTDLELAHKIIEEHLDGES